LRPFGLAIADIENELLTGGIVILPTNGRKNGLRLTAIDHAQVADNHQVSDRLGAVQGTEGKGSSRPVARHVPARLKVNGASVKKTSIVGVKKVNYGPVAIRVVKPWNSHRQAFGRDRDLDYFSARNWYVSWQISANEGGFKEMLAYRAT
jgi:hypothetical protein